MPRGRRKKKSKPNTLKPNILYEIQYTGPATGIQVAGLRFRKGIKRHLLGNQISLTIPEIKQWGLVFKEIKEEKKIEIELNKEININSPDKNYTAIWLGKEMRSIHLLGDVLIFKDSKAVKVTKKQAQILKKMGFKIQLT